MPRTLLLATVRIPSTLLSRLSHHAVALRHVTQKRAVILDTARDFRISALNFTDRYIVNPLLEVQLSLNIPPKNVDVSHDSLR